MAKSRRVRAERVMLRVLILKDNDFNKFNARDHLASWDQDTCTIYLRESRTGQKRLSDFLHECKHAWVDAVDDER